MFCSAKVTWFMQNASEAIECLPFLTVKEGYTFPSKPLPSGTRGCNRPPVLGTATL